MSWSRIVSSKLPGQIGWDKLGPDGGPINSAMQQHMSDATNPDRKRWTGFAVAALRSGKYDMSYYPGDNASQGPTVTHPDSSFWGMSPQAQADRAAFFAESNGYKWEDHTTGSFNPIKAISSAVNTVTKEIGKVPIAGKVLQAASKVFTAPVSIAASIASGERLDHVAVGALKDQLKTVKAIAPYAATVVSFVPGIGTGVAAAISAGAALAEGQSISEAAEAAIRGALPGGALATAGFDAAVRIAKGQNVSQAALESARNLIPPGAGQQAFDIGLAVVTGKKLQAQGVASTAVQAPMPTATLAPTAPRAPAPPPAMRTQLLSPPLAKKAVVPATAALTVHVPGAYAPYPKMIAGLGAIGPVAEDAVWGPAITDMDGAMQWAGRSAVHGSKGRPRAVQGPDGRDYLFEINNGALIARPRIA